MSLTERHFRVDDHANLTDQPDQSVQNSSQVPEDHADVVTATAEHGKKRVAPWVPFRVLRLSRPSFFMCPIIGSIALRRRRSLAIVPVDTTLRAADENHSHFHAMATISAIDKGHPGPLVCDGLDLFQRLGQRVAIMGIARQRPYPDHKAAPVGRSHADPGAKLVALVRLAPGNAVHRRFMQTVELFPVFRHRAPAAGSPAQSSLPGAPSTCPPEPCPTAARCRAAPDQCSP